MAAIDRLILRTAINAIALWAAAQLITGISYDSIPSLIGVALLFGLVNAVLLPILKLLTCPLILLSLGLFTFVINALLLALAAALGRRLGLGFWVESFGAAFWGALVVSIVSVLLSFVFKEGKPRDE